MEMRQTDCQGHEVNEYIKMYNTYYMFKCVAMNHSLGKIVFKLQSYVA
jgi:hypothetical protein